MPSTISEQHRSYTLLYGQDAWGDVPLPMRPWPCGILATRTRPCRGVSRRWHVSRGAVSPLQPGVGPGVVWPELLSLSPGGARTQERAEALLTLSNEQRFALSGRCRQPAAGLGAGRCKARERGGPCADTPGPGRLAGHGGSVVPAAFSWPSWPRRRECGAA